MTNVNVTVTVSGASRSLSLNAPATHSDVLYQANLPLNSNATLVRVVNGVAQTIALSERTFQDIVYHGDMYIVSETKTNG